MSIREIFEALVILAILHRELSPEIVQMANMADSDYDAVQVVAGANLDRLPSVVDEALRFLSADVAEALCQHSKQLTIPAAG